MAAGLAPVSEALPEGDFAEWRLAGDGYEISLMKARYRSGGQGVFRCARSVLQYVLECDTRLTLAPEDPADDHGFSAIGPLTFVAPQVAIQARWRPGRLHRLLCEIDLERLTQRMGHDPASLAFPLPANLRLDSPFIAVMMRRLAEEAIDPGYGAALRVDSLMLAIAIDLTRLLQGAANQSVAAAADRLTALQVRAVHDLIDSSEDPTVDSLGEAFDMTGRRLSSLYRRTTGVTLRAHLAEARVQRAEALLLDPKIKIKTIAHRCGFRSTAAFDAAFRRVTGMTPHEFRETTCRHL